MGIRLCAIQLRWVILSTALGPEHLGGPIALGGVRMAIVHNKEA
jgi:hypothetical protein